MITIAQSQTQLTWIDPDENLPTGITLGISESLCGGEYNFAGCEWIENPLQSDSKIWPYPLIEGVHFQSDCNMNAVFTSTVEPCSFIADSGITIVTYTIEDGCSPALIWEFQIEVTCNACLSGALPACPTCEESFPGSSCYSCDVNELSAGLLGCLPSYLGEEPQPGQPSSLCAGGIPNNMSWFSFTAGTEEIEITMCPDNCIPGEDGLIGIEAGIYDKCAGNGGACLAGDASCPDNEVCIGLSLNNIIVGQDYFVYVDGCGGSQCLVDITITGQEAFKLDNMEAVSIETACGIAASNSFISGEAIRFNVNHRGDSPTDNGIYNIAGPYDPAQDLCFEWSFTPPIESMDMQTWSQLSLGGHATPWLILPEVTQATTYTICIEDVFSSCDDPCDDADCTGECCVDILVNPSNIVNFGDPIIFNTQADVDSFDPQISIVNGDLTIGNLSQNSDISDLSTLSNITSINGSLQILRNPLLENIDVLSNISEVSSCVRVEQNNMLRDLDGFSTLIQVSGDLIIRDNLELTSVDSLEKLESVGGGLIVSDNPNLIECCGIFTLLANTSMVSGLIIIHNNSSPCESSQQIINEACSFPFTEEFHFVVGETRVDVQNDGCNDTDQLHSYMKFLIEGESNFRVLRYGDLDGSHNIGLPEGRYTIEPQLQDLDYYNVQPESITVTFPDSLSPYKQDFCIIPAIDTTILSLSITPISQARPGYTSFYKIKCENRGTLPASGIITFVYPTEVMDFSGVSGSASNITNMEDQGLITIDVSGLQAMDNISYTVLFNLNRPTDIPPLSGGAILEFSASFETNNLQNTLLFTTDLSQIVVDSYDPNDKRLLEGEFLLPEKIGDFVRYLIRFENTGTADAINIAISDNIDPTMFDISTLEIVDASHPVETSISGDVVEFIFRDINLPFADDNDDGHVLFRIRTNSNLEVGDEISNYADIYFDFNAAITTNIVTTTFENISSTTKIYNPNISVYPNPAMDLLQININNDNLIKYKIFNTVGKVQAVSDLINKTIDISHLTNGTYLLQIVIPNPEELILTKFVVLR